MSTTPWAPTSLYDYSAGGNRISELMMRRGQIQADRAARSGEIWGGAIQGVGQQIGSALQQHSQEQEKRTQATSLAKRDAAATSFIEAWDGKDPKTLLTGLTKIMGPGDGPKMAQGVMAFQGLTEAADEKDLARLQKLTVTAAKMPDPMLARFWPAIRQKAAPTIERWLGVPANSLPEEFTPEVRQTINAMAEAWSGAKPEDEYTLSPGQQRRRGSEIIAENPVAPAKGPAVGTFEDYVVQKFGPRPTPQQIEVARKGYAQADNAAPQASFQVKEVLDDEGKPAMANFDARTGRYVNASTGEAIKTPRPVPPASETKDARKFQQAAPILKSVAELSEKINTQQGLIAKAAGGAAKVAAKANLNDDVAEYQALVMGFTPLIARALGHTGVLTEQDVVSVRALFPAPGDSKTLRDRKVARISLIISQLEGGEQSAKPAAPADPLGIR